MGRTLPLAWPAHWSTGEAQWLRLPLHPPHKHPTALQAAVLLNQSSQQDHHQQQRQACRAVVCRAQLGRGRKGQQRAVS